MLKIKKGLNLPITGKPSSEIDDSKTVRSVAILGEDYPGMKPTMAVAPGDRSRKARFFSPTKKSKVLFLPLRYPELLRRSIEDRKRAFISLVVEAAGDEAVTFSQLRCVRTEQARAFCSRRAAFIQWRVDSAAHEALFADSVAPVRSEFDFCYGNRHEPTGGRPKTIIASKEAEFSAGLSVLARLTDGAVHLCQDSSSPLEASNDDRITSHVFEGPHPAGLPGTHIHFVDPVSPNKTVWFIGYQDVIAIGHLFLRGDGTQRAYHCTGWSWGQCAQTVQDLRGRELRRTHRG